MRFIRGRAPLVVIAFVAAACTGSSATGSSATGSSASFDSAAQDDAVAKVRSAITNSGGLDGFSTDPLPGEGRILCVDGDEIHLYLFESEAERAEAASLIDPGDPSRVGNALVAWSGNPVFWEVGTALVLYLGPDEELLDELVEGLGESYAAGLGRTGAIDLSC